MNTLPYFLILKAYIVYNLECRILWVETQKQRSLLMSAHLLGLILSLNLKSFSFVQIICFFCQHTFCFSCSSANETLSTLKFAQRAKLIQNNVLKLHALVSLYVFHGNCEVFISIFNFVVFLIFLGQSE